MLDLRAMGRLVYVSKKFTLGFCACGCGKQVKNRNSTSCKFVRFVHGHNMKGEHNRGPNCHHWKGDKVQYVQLHYWVRTHLPKPKSCEFCKQEKKLDLACITGIYQREFNNWKYLCRSCHIKLDDNQKKAWETRRKKIMSRV